MTRRTLLLLALAALCSLHLNGCRTEPTPTLLWEVQEEVLETSELGPGARRVALVGSQTVTVRDALSGEVVGSPIDWPRARGPRFLDNERLAVMGGQSIRVYEIESGRQLSALELPGLASMLQAEANLVGAGVRGEGVHLYSADNLEKLWSFDCLASALAISPRGKLVAVACRDKVVILDARTGQEVRQLPFSSVELEFCPRGEFLAVHSIEKGGGQNRLRVFHTTNWREMGHNYKTVAPFHFSWSPSGASFLTGFERNLRHWAVGQPRLLMSKKVDQDICALALSSTEDYAFYGTLGGTRALVNARDGGTVHSFEKGRVKKAAFGPGGKHLFLQLQGKHSTYQAWDLYGSPEEKLASWLRSQ